MDLRLLGSKMKIIFNPVVIVVDYDYDVDVDDGHDCDNDS
jgi:hypothetical protein